MNSTYQLFQNYRSQAQNSKCSGPFVIGLWRGEKLVHRQQEILDPKHPDTILYLKVLLKSLLWIYGAHRLSLEGDDTLKQMIHSLFASDGALHFERGFFEGLFGASFSIDNTKGESATNSSNGHLTLSTKGARVGLDLGGSSIKACLLREGKIEKTQLKEWNPLDQANPKDGSYIVEKILETISSLLPDGENPDSIGISTAGVVMEGELYLSSLYRYFENPSQCRDLTSSLGLCFDCPIHIINDGEAAALEIPENDGAVAIVLGSDEGGGYLAPNKISLDQINELAFVPVILDADAPIDSWSKHRGTGGVYLSIRGLEYYRGQGLSDSACAIEMGKVLAHALAFYGLFFPFKSILLLGGVTSEGRGKIMQQSCLEELTKLNLASSYQFVEVSGQFRFQQAITAAKLQWEEI